MMRITMVTSKRELNRCIFSHSWRCFWKKKDLLANQVDETNVFRSCSWEDVIHFFFFNFQIHHLAGPSFGIQGVSIPSILLMDVNFCGEYLTKCIIDMKYIRIQSCFICLKVGQLKISEMRQRAETELKEKFDIKDFHEVTHWFSFPGS